MTSGEIRYCTQTTIHRRGSELKLYLHGLGYSTVLHLLSYLQTFGESEMIKVLSNRPSPGSMWRITNTSPSLYRLHQQLDIRELTKPSILYFHRFQWRHDRMIHIVWKSECSQLRLYIVKARGITASQCSWRDPGYYRGATRDHARQRTLQHTSSA